MATDHINVIVARPSAAGKAQAQGAAITAAASRLREEGEPVRAQAGDAKRCLGCGGLVLRPSEHAC